jgi:glycosyltransferase involved in cell wall biosynthesis
VKIALISHGDANSPRHFSGIPWHVLQELRRQGHIVEPFYAEPANWAKRLAHVKNLFSLKFSRQPHNPEADTWILRTRSMGINQKIRQFAPDAVLCVGLPEAAVSLSSTFPLYVWMDAFYPGLRRFYAYFRDYYSEQDARVLQGIEDGVLQRARKIWLSSEWALAESRADFPKAAARMTSQSFGANLQNPPTATETKQTISTRNLTAPTLLFLANEWERKGGDIAVETVRRVRVQGCPARLVMVGLKTKPASVPEEPWLEWVGPLDKGRPDEARRLQTYFAESAFLLLPSRADCTPIVCHEAGAHGLPVLATDVGGLPSTVTSGESGQLWPCAKFADEAPGWIISILADRPRYETFAQAARQRYEAIGNWAVNVRAVTTAIAKDLAQPQTTPV